MEKIKRALITGVNGFVGPLLAKELDSMGYEVHGCGREERSFSELLKSVLYYVCDVTDKDSTARLLADIRPTHVFHLAGIGSPAQAETDRETAFKVHVNGTVNVLEAASAAGSPRVLIVSSGNVYGPPLYLPLREDHPLGGKGAYAESRILQEARVAEYMPRLPIVVARSFNHTGSGQSPDYVFSKIVKTVADIARGRATELSMGRTDLRRECLHAADVVRAYRLLLEQTRFGVTVNVCRGSVIALKDVIEYAKVLAGLPAIRVTGNPAFMGKNDIFEIVGDTKLLHSFIDWQPAYGYEAIVKDLYNYWYAQ